MEASVVTVADLHRFTHSPWCPKCGAWWEDQIPKQVACIKGHSVLCAKRALWIRFPDVRPPGLEWRESRTRDVSHHSSWWSFRYIKIDAAEASLQILGGIVEGAPTISFTYLKTSRRIAMIAPPPDTPLHGQQFVGEADTYTEAACIAMHRYGDSKEQQDG